MAKKPTITTEVDFGSVEANGRFFVVTRTTNAKGVTTAVARRPVEPLDVVDGQIVETDLSRESQAVRDAAATLWTEGAVALFASELAKQQPPVSAADILVGEIRGKAARMLRQGFPFKPKGAKRTYHLQFRDDTDRTNMLMVMQTAVATKQANDLSGMAINEEAEGNLVPLRTQENVTLRLPLSEVLKLLARAFRWYSSIQETAWDYVDRARAEGAPSIDLEADWNISTGE